MRDSAENQIGMVFIRHGETDSNRRKSYLGWTDEPLSVEGREVIAQNKKKISECGFYFYKSDVKVQTDKRDYIWQSVLPDHRKMERDEFWQF